MAMFPFLKKKTDIPLPPPPAPPDIAPVLRGDIEPIRAPEPAELPEEESYKPFELRPEPVFEPIPELPLEPVEDKTIASEPPQQPLIKPAFVSVDDFKRIINDTNTIRAKLMDAEKFVRKLSDIKNEEEKAFEKWRNQLEGIEKKLSYVDQLISQAQR